MKKTKIVSQEWQSYFLWNFSKIKMYRNSLICLLKSSFYELVNL